MLPVALQRRSKTGANSAAEQEGREAGVRLGRYTVEAVHLWVGDGAYFPPFFQLRRRILCFQGTKASIVSEVTFKPIDSGG